MEQFFILVYKKKTKNSSVQEKYISLTVRILTRPVDTINGQLNLTHLLIEWPSCQTSHI